jgi:hypothetical protein
VSCDQRRRGGIVVSHKGVWRCLRRQGLNTRAKRLSLVAGYAAAAEGGAGAELVEVVLDQRLDERCTAGDEDVTADLPLQLGFFQPPRSNPSAPPGSSITPSRVMNSDTTSFPITRLLLRRS